MIRTWSGAMSVRNPSLDSFALLCILTAHLRPKDDDVDVYDPETDLYSTSTAPGFDLGRDSEGKTIPVLDDVAILD